MKPDSPALLALLKPLLDDPDITEILVDNFAHIYVERNGILEDVDSPYATREQLLADIADLSRNASSPLNAETPFLDTRLADGSRVHVVMPPVALDGPVMNIRKFPRNAPKTFGDLLGYNVLSEDAAAFLKLCVRSRLNLMIAGGTGSGKTTLMNIVSREIDDEERIVAIGALAELNFQKPRLITLEGRQANLDGKGEVTVRDLIRSAVKMRPDRILVTDVLGGEVLDIFDAINTGHNGTIFSIHAKGVHDALARMEMMAAAGNPMLPLLNIREQIASTVDVILYQERLATGDRKLMKIAAVQGMRGDAVLIEDLFEFHKDTVVNGQTKGFMSATGKIPRFLGQLREAEPEFSMDLFKPR
jgi:pilus assembly protein CpaF